MSVTTDNPGAAAVRPFTIPKVPEAELKELRSRIAATRWPDRETVTDDSQGVPLAMLQGLARYWATDYDWRKCEAKLNALPHFITEIDGLDIHFIHVRSGHDNALPLIVTHGWPGSVIEQLKIIGPLTDPTAHGAAASDAFHLVIPSLPGYGYSGKPRQRRLGPRPHRTRLGRADEAPRLPALRLARRRLGRGGHERDGAAGTAGTARHSRQLPRHGPARRGQGAPGRRPAASRPVSRRTTRLRAAEQVVHEAARLRRPDGDAPADAVRTGRLTRRPGRLAAGPRGRLGPAGGAGHLGRARAHQPRASRRRPHPRRRPGQHHAVLADQHGSVLGPPVLGKQDSACTTPPTCASRRP